VTKFAEVVFNISLDHSFSYVIPKEWLDIIKPGLRVLAPLGKQILTGVVVEIKSEVAFDNLKEITDILDEKPLLSNDLLNLTKWISEYYMSSWGQAVLLALPKGIDESAKRRLYVKEDFDDTKLELSERENELKELIFRNPGKTYKYYQEKFGKNSLNYLSKKLIDKNVLISESKAERPTVQSKKRYFITVPKNIEKLLKNVKPQNKKLEGLIEFACKDILLADLLKKLDTSSTVVDRLVNNNILVKSKKEVFRYSEIKYEEVDKKITLTKDQNQVFREIQNGVIGEKFITYLLHGVTGSGKTQVYIESLREVYSKKKSAIILIPEISLTPQTVSRFKKYFGEKVTVFNSKMSLGERYDAWFKIYREETSIIIGPRSALFLPVKNLGVIIVDEEHDGSYKQSDSAPRYHARDVAIFLARMQNAVVVLGSATPGLESYFNARKNKYTLLELPNRINNVPMPHVSIVDTRGINAKKGSKIFSPILIKKIKDRLDKSEQIILLQNRRGHSSFLQCTDCGFIARCPNCEISLTYHKYNHKLQCHYCNYVRNAVETCPKCSSYHVKYSGVGTQKIESEMKRLFPGVKYLRMDQDTTKSKRSHDEILYKFKQKQSDILLGTQMISKGLDFENVTLVGVISADVGLSLPDFRSTERIFQLLTQVAGRSGRGEIPGEVIVQSYQFSHSAIQLASKHDHSGYYLNEMKNRMELDYPPFHRIVNVRVSGLDLQKTISTIREITSVLRKTFKKYYKTVGPAPAPIAKINNFYRWHLFIKIDKTRIKSGKDLKKVLYPFIKNNNNELKVQFDVDPVDLM
jgi:primosomal protein N' (replication factor Y) (superfamily II helicase)